VIPDTKTVVRCDCGYQVTANDEAALVDAIRRHARDVHGTVCSYEEALTVILRADLDAVRPGAPPSA
jgi:predicted small metal-binding protein